MENNEKTLWDLCVACFHGIAYGIRSLIAITGRSLQISYRHWWLVGLVVIIALAGALYYTRQDNRKYKVNAIVTLNGPTSHEVKTCYEALDQSFPDAVFAAQSLGQQLGLSAEDCRTVECIRAFYVIDNKHDGLADYVDWDRHNSGTDTVNVRMRDQLALQFVTRRVDKIALLEEHIITYLNAQPSFARAYEAYRMNMERQKQFDLQQIEKLDTMTSRMYAQAGQTQIQSNAWNLMMGKQQISLPLGDIEEYMKRKALRDTRATLCTAPVVLQGHFVAEARPINTRGKWCVIALIAGWIIGCLLAFVWEQRRAIRTYLSDKN